MHDLRDPGAARAWWPRAGAVAPGPAPREQGRVRFDRRLRTSSETDRLRQAGVFDHFSGERWEAPIPGDTDLLTLCAALPRCWWPAPPQFLAFSRVATLASTLAVGPTRRAGALLAHSRGDWNGFWGLCMGDISATAQDEGPFNHLLWHARRSTAILEDIGHELLGPLAAIHGHHPRAERVEACWAKIVYDAVIGEKGLRAALAMMTLIAGNMERPVVAPADPPPAPDASWPLLMEPWTYNGLRVHHLNSVAAIQEEGRIQAHCLGRYPVTQVSGRFVCLSLREADWPERRISTAMLEWQHGRLVPIAHHGFHNTKPSDHAYDVLMEFVAAAAAGAVVLREDAIFRGAHGSAS